ncbi:alpha-L-rhamnosidase-related protein [Saccharopolyspora pogona]|uniref:alpha-L-rhamnosidase-related protein n=1 Tax=Saccharopolyspora pogona TaxID=333966 RepID=UPI00168467B1|nr:alpha-L-rhamnosidase N-terminal domain-containing protein [Saccharopolyspora pogona]
MTGFVSHTWRGVWIGAPGGVTPGFHRVLFRRTLTLPAVPAAVPARISADSRYRLFVNGAAVGQGPQRSQPHRIRFDERDLAPLLRAGTNVLAALVTFFGESNAIWQAAVPSGRLGSTGALLFEADFEDHVLVSDPAWRTHRSDAWTALRGGRLDGVPAERLDARLLDTDWASPDYDDSGWNNAVPVTAEYRGGQGRALPPVAPFGLPLPRTLPVLEETRREPESVRAGIVTTSPACEELHPWQVARSAVAERPCGMRVPDGGAQVVSVDFGRVVAGHFEFELDAPEGTVVDIGFNEREPGVTDELAPVAGVRYIARGTVDRFTAQEAAGMRSAVLVITPPVSARVSVRDIGLVETIQPWGDGATFRSGDAELDALYHAGIRTVRVNTTDALTDCPTREQRAWTGDGVVHQSVHLAANTDWSAARAYVELANSPRPDGLLPMAVAGDFEAGGATTIPSWSLHWIHGVRELHAHLGPVSEVVDALSTAQRVLAWFLPFLSDRGTLDDVPEWNLVDWSSVVTTGRTAAVTGLWVRALREFAEVSRAFGNNGAAEWAFAHASRARAGFEEFWDEQRGVYVDSIVGERRLPAVSQATNAIAIAARIAPRERWDGIVARITDPRRLVRRSWLGGAGGGVDLSKWERVSSGELILDWDVEREIVRAEPFLSYVVHDALAAAGRVDLIVNALRDWTSFLRNGNDTFGETWGWGSPCHGWSSTPTRDLVRYVLGVRPGSAGFHTAIIAPRPHGIRELSGAVPTGHGLIEVDIRGADIAVRSPVPFRFDPPGGGSAYLPAGQHTLSAG